MPVSDLAAYFSGQLIDLHWLRIGGGSDKSVAWSSWRIPRDGGWRAVLLVIAAFDSGDRSLSLLLEREDDRESGGSSYTALSSSP